MKKQTASLIPLIANVATIVVAAWAIYLFVHRYILVSRPTVSLTSIERSIPTTLRQAAPRTILLVLSTDCHFCAESAPLYRELSRRRNPLTRLVAAFPENVEASMAYLKLHGITVDEVIQQSPVAFSVPGTPTVVVIDRRRGVRAWFGQLKSADEAALLHAVAEPPET